MKRNPSEYEARCPDCGFNEWETLLEHREVVRKDSRGIWAEWTEYETVRCYECGHTKEVSFDKELEFENDL